MGKAENHVERYLRQRVNALVGMCLKFTSGVNGVPDRIVLLNDRTVFVKLKTNNGRLSPLQTVQIARMRDCGADLRAINTRELVDEFITEISGSSSS